jgi:hypothetical protein
MSEGSEVTFAILNLHDEEQVIAYERALFRAYTSSVRGMPSEQFIIQKAERRARHKLPYEAQMIFMAKQKDAVVAAIAANMDMSNPMSTRGKSLADEGQANNACEILFMFSLMDYTQGIPTLGNLGKFARDQVKDKNIEVIYAFPCSAAAKVPLQKAGFGIAEEKSENGKQETMMFMSIAEHGSNGQ